MTGVGANGAFAEYVVASASFGVVRLPNNWSFEDGAQLGIAPFTALQTLYESHNIPAPQHHHWTAKPILISGAASSVGQWVVQFAQRSGFYVIATASEKNFDLVKALGADEVYDYHDPDVVQKIRLTTKGELKLAVDTICEGNTPKLVFDALSDEGGVVAAISPYPMPPREGITVISSVVFDMLGKVSSTARCGVRGNRSWEIENSGLRISWHQTHQHAGSRESRIAVREGASEPPRKGGRGQAQSRVTVL